MADNNNDKEKRDFLAEMTVSSVLWLIFSSVINGILSFMAWTFCGWWWVRLKRWWESRKKT